MSTETPVHIRMFEVASEWCERHPGWMRICDIPNTDALYLTWEELPRKVRAAWERDFHSSAENAWREFGHGVCKVDVGFIGTDGVFYPRITDVPTNTNCVQVYHVAQRPELLAA